jgi:hypothetical protein
MAKKRHRSDKYTNSYEDTHANRANGYLIKGVAVVVTIGTLICAFGVYDAFMNWYTTVEEG